MKSRTEALAPDRVFHVHSVSKVYHMGYVEVRALRSVELDLLEGEFVVFRGPSGSGKSTLLNILGRLDTSTAREVRFRDHVLSGADDRALTRFRREHVGFVFQFYNLIPSLTALENVALVTEIADRRCGNGGTASLHSTEQPCVTFCFHQNFLQVLA